MKHVSHIVRRNDGFVRTVAMSCAVLAACMAGMFVASCMRLPPGGAEGGAMVLRSP